MLKRVLSVLLLAASCLAATNKSTIITGTFQDPSGSPFNGTLTLTLPFAGAVTQEGISIPPVTVSYTIQNGVILNPVAQLINNVDIVPGGTYYIARTYDYTNTQISSFYISIPDVASFNIGGAQQSIYSSNNVSLFNPGSITATGSFVSSGLYSCYFCSTIGGANTVASPVQDAVAGSIVTPASVNSGINNFDGIAGYALCNNPFSGIRGGCVALYGVSKINASGGGAWGINTTTSDFAGISSALYGYEADMYALGTPTKMFGFQLTLNGNGQVPLSQSFGINIQGTSNTNVTNPYWATGIEISDLCCIGAMQIGVQEPGGANSPSMFVQFARQDGSGNRQVDIGFDADASGDFEVKSASPGFGGIKFPSVAFASLPSSPLGVMIYCNNCKNVSHDGATAGALCVTGGTGAFAKREYSTTPQWDCN